MAALGRERHSQACGHPRGWGTRGASPPRPLTVSPGCKAGAAGRVQMSPGGLGCGSGACGALSRPSPVPPPRLGLGALSLDAGPATAPSRTWVAAPHQASPSRPRQSGHISSRVCLPGPRAPGTERPAPPGLPGTSGRTPRPHRGRHQAPSAALASPWTVVLEAAQAQLWRHGVTPCAAHTRDPLPSSAAGPPG